MRLSKNKFSETDVGPCQKHITKLESELLKSMNVTDGEIQPALDTDIDISE